MHIQRVMDRTGDSRFEFDPSNAAAVAEAEKRFTELTGTGFRAAEKTGEGHSRLIRGFDPNVEETVFIQPLVGG